jgi:hypothetical protein
MKKEHDNLNAALAWSLDGHDLDLAVSLAAALGRHYFRYAGNRREAARTLEHVVACQPPPSPSLAWLLISLAVFEKHWDVRSALACSEQAYAIAATTGSLELRAACALTCGVGCERLGQSERAQEFYEEATELAHACGDGWTECAGTVNLANLALGSADYPRAGALSEAALALSHHVDPMSQVTIHCLRSVTEVRLRRESDAIATVRDAIHSVRMLDLPPIAVSEWVRTCAIVATRAGNAERAARPFGHDEFLRERNETRLDPTDERELNEALKILKAKLYADLSSAWQHGRSMSTTDALAEVHKEFDQPHQTSGPATIPLRSDSVVSSHLV